MTQSAAGQGLPAVRVFSTLATKVAWPRLVRGFERLSGHGTDDVFGPTNALMQRIENGETADVAIMVRESARALAEDGTLVDCADIAVSYVGLAVKAGAAKPDIATVDALRAALLAARSIAYSQQGASGIYFAGLIGRLGIADAVNAKATIVLGGFTAERVACGETELAVQQLSELMAVDGIDIVGPFPRELQEPAVLTAGVFARSDMIDVARRLVAFLASPKARPILASSGLEPVKGDV